MLIIQQVSETIEKVIRQLEAQGESIDEQRVLIQQIISKYPPEVVTKLEETKQPLKRQFVIMLQYKRMYNVMFLVLTLM